MSDCRHVGLSGNCQEASVRTVGSAILPSAALRSAARRSGVLAFAFAAAAALFALRAPAAAAAPPPPVPVPPRTAISVRTIVPGVRFGTANQDESRPGLSIVKLYMADFALRHGDGSAEDRSLAERMIRFSDDGAAGRMHRKYPTAIDAVAGEYHLPHTRTGDDWGSSYTSTSDVVAFLRAKDLGDPASPILRWMAEPAPRAADGTAQDWGTARVPWVRGTKWGWSDYGPSQVASASFGPGFAIAVQTRGTTADQDADLLGALPGIVVSALANTLAGG
jgi:hypothetical protein